MELKLTTKDGRVFDLEAARPYQRRDGTASSIAIWRGACRLCGAPFETTTSGSLVVVLASKGFSRVHCDAHKLRRRPKATPQQSEGGADSPAIDEKNRNETPSA